MARLRFTGKNWYDFWKPFFFLDLVWNAFSPIRLINEKSSLGQCFGFLLGVLQ